VSKLIVFDGRMYFISSEIWSGQIQPCTISYSSRFSVVEVAVLVGAVLTFGESLLFSLFILFMETKLLAIPSDSRLNIPATESLKS
jgi:prepilin signal peptidase PulO-like enzyme (type II secretory pathway)